MLIRYSKISKVMYMFDRLLWIYDQCLRFLVNVKSHSMSFKFINIYCCICYAVETAYTVHTPIENIYTELYHNFKNV